MCVLVMMAAATTTTTMVAAQEQSGGGPVISSPLFGDTTLTKIFVGGLAWETQRETMRRHFEQYGEILEAVVITDKNTGRSKGYGFVTFSEPESARRACLDPTPVIDGRRANCNLAYLGAQRSRPSFPSFNGNRARFMAPFGANSAQLGGATTYIGAPAFGQYAVPTSFPYQSYGYGYAPGPYSPEYTFPPNVYRPAAPPFAATQVYAGSPGQLYQYMQSTSSPQVLVPANYIPSAQQSLPHQHLPHQHPLPHQQQLYYGPASPLPPPFYGGGRYTNLPSSTGQQSYAYSSHPAATPTPPQPSPAMSSSPATSAYAMSAPPQQQQPPQQPSG